MKYKSFSQDIWQQIEKALDDEKKITDQPIAAFDADGTLWDTDLGESFFQYQIKKNLLPHIFSKLSKDPWRHYRDWKESGDPRPAYLWLAQINSGIQLKTVQKWAKENVEAQNPLPLFPDQQKLISHLMKQGCRVYIVTASVKWSVEPGAALYQIPEQNVLGVKTRIENNQITDQQEGEITYREGKLTALLDETGGLKPFLCCGNSTGDLQLLEGATRIRLAVGAAKENHELYRVESQLRQIAEQKNWLYHQF